mgnify:CR=1 FL=1
MISSLVSVIIPVYNVKNYLDKCLKSVVNQTYGKLEIILVDDGSTDGSDTMCDIWKKNDSRIKVIHKKNGGLSDARNVGISNAKGEYITFIDSDDFIENDMIEELLFGVKNNNCDIGICGYYKTYLNEEYIADSGKNNMIMNRIDAIDKMNSLGYYDVSAWGKIFKTEIFNKITFPVGKLSEDWFIMYKLFYRAEKIYYNPKPKYHYVQRSGGISKNNPKINYDSIEAATECMQFIEKNCPEIIENAIINYCIANIAVFNSCVLYDRDSQSEYNAINNNFRVLMFTKNMSFKKKMQFFIFVKFNKLYKCIYKIYFNKIRYKDMIK